MQTRRSATSALSLVLPHPPLPRTSSNSSISPRTPRSSCGPQTPILFRLESSTPRKSSDSWTSSTYDADAVEWEWTADQVSLLANALDVLPQQVLTPFVGPIPPSNLLDKVAKGICASKGPLEWPHSIAATRLKLVELSREAARRRSCEDTHSIPEEESENADPNQDDVDITIGKAAGRKKVNNDPKRKPLYRQNSMDFLRGSMENESSIPRLSTRLQRTSRLLPSNSYHPYARPSGARSPSPVRSTSLLTPPGPATPVRNRSQLPGLRRASSSFTISSTSSISFTMPAPPDPPANTRTLRTRTPQNTRTTRVKRAPSFSAVSVQEKVDRLKLSNSSEAVSSDEEEKARSASAKKPRTRKNSQETDRATAREEKAPASKKPAAGLKPKVGASPTKLTVKTRVKRSDSMFGAPLPTPPVVSPSLTIPPPPLPAILQEKPETEAIAPRPVSPPKSLRRVKTANFPARPGRRISFGSIVPHDNSSSVSGSSEGTGLQSAFSLS
ncbi:hypothetical protein SISNIDRAFT_490411 [Sistotremastrum niveocremeum HHB9708]|uniref:Uncharacterized protein n=2 Tax=Sistotremastraceae TaxID=3402574 RepID=A0A164NUL4_9AGAM|nr:hypothetical protein SISNIDRAFT_490411 [Sistotremastrum niveocremeum HHB9708]KZT40518.1 hypothetical protein SISSUDRAFT_1060285 [Sistotremastrum suecicum HHB10207 ss-3]